MPVGVRNNPLALAVLVCLAERPMHPYEAAATLRERQKDLSVRLNFGSLYAVVASLEKRGLIAARGVVRSGRRPERTVYELTPPGQEEMESWLADLLSTPARDYTRFEAALSFLPAVAPDTALSLLRERATQLAALVQERDGTRGMLGDASVPRLFWVEEEYRDVLRRAELDFVRALIADVETGGLAGSEWWHEIHATSQQVHGDV